MFRWLLLFLASIGFGQITTFPASGGGGGSVNSVAGACGLSSSGSSAITITNSPGLNAQTGTTYTVLSSDCGKIVTHSNGSAVAYTLPQATGSFGAGFVFYVQNRGAGTVTITPTTSTIDGAASLALTQNQGVMVLSDGTNWYSMRGVGSAGGGTVQFQSDGTNIGSPRSTLDFLGSTTVTLTGNDTGSKVTIQPTVNTSVMLSRATDQAGIDGYCRSTTGNDSYVCSLTPTLTTYTRGMILTLDADTANTGTATVNVDTLGAKSILNRAGGALADGDITANKPILVSYDGTQFVIVGDGGGSAPAPTDDTYANRPTCNAAATGKVFYASDITWKHWICDGSTWRAYGFGMRLTEPPAAASWTTVVSSGGGSPTVTDVGGAIRYVGGSSGGSAIVTAVPGSTPYSVVLAFTSAAAENNGSFLTLCGLALTDGTGTSANRMIVGFFDVSNTSNSSDYRIYINYYTNVGTYSAQLSKRTTMYPGTPPLLRYRDDGTNRYVDLWDGSGWLNALSESRTTFLTATHYGFTCDSNKASATLYHWKP